MERLLSLSLCLMIALLSFAHDFEVDGIYYNITSKSEPYTVAVTYRYGYKYTGAVTIPQKVTSNGTTYSVTNIASYAFDNCKGLTSVSIPNSVTSIGYGSFRGCSGLPSVTIPNSVTSIGGGAFQGCTGLTSVTLPNSVTSIDDNAFENCTGMNSVTIPSSVTSIGKKAFEGCSGLEKVIVKDLAAWCKVSFYNSFANPLFYSKHLYSDENTEITDLVIPNSVTRISSCAFSGCDGLTSVTIPNSVTSIGVLAFYYCI